MLGEAVGKGQLPAIVSQRDRIDHVPVNCRATALLGLSPLQSSDARGSAGAARLQGGARGTCWHLETQRGSRAKQAPHPRLKRQ